MPKYFIYCRKSSEAEDKQALSIEAQIKEVTQRYIEQEKLDIVEILQESFSAKRPGRPIFDAMMKRIQRGEADGIIAWHPDRLARNSLDGGKIIYFLDNGKLQDLRFPTYNYENTSQGKFMLAIMFGQSKYYVDSLSENVKRGLRLKLEKGVLPGLPPLGYLNEPRERNIVKDPERFDIVRKLWDLMLSGNYSVSRILEIASNELGFRTRKFRRIGGKKLAKSGLYKIFGNPFYYGLIEREGITYQGVHDPMITEEEFWQVRRLLGRHGRPRPKKHEFAFTGLIRCGECGCSITAEEHYNRYGSHYIYYRCTKKKRPCSQRYIETKKLERQVVETLNSISMSPGLVDWAFKYLDKLDGEENKVKANARESLEKALKETEKNLENLTSMRIKDFVTDEEYLAQRNKLLREKESLRLKLQRDPQPQDWLEPTKECFIFASRAKFWFTEGNLEQKRLIVNSLGSNLFLKDKKLSLELQKPFSIIEEGLKSRSWCGLVDDVRIFFQGLSKEATLIKTNLAKLKRVQNVVKKAA